MKKSPKLSQYKKKFLHSFALGYYPTIELLDNAPELVIKILLHDKGKGSAAEGKIFNLANTHGIAVERNSSAVEKISYKGGEYAVGVFEKYEVALSENQMHTVLIEPRDRGNLGGIIRSMDAFDARNLVLIGNSADIFHPLVIRASMGSLFRINFAHFDSWEEYRENFSQREIFILSRGGRNISDTKFPKNCSLVLGSEGPGVPREMLEEGKIVEIPQSEHVDSLNLSVSAGIALFSLCKRK